MFYFRRFVNSFVIILGLATIAESCKDGDIVADKTDATCTKLILCDHGKPVILSCPSGLMFNPEIKACDWPANVDCPDNSISGEDGEGEAILPPENPATTSSTSTSALPSSSQGTTTSATTPSSLSPPPAPAASQTKPTPVPAITTTTTVATDPPTTGNSISTSNSDIKFAPYFDVLLKGPTLVDVYKKTGQKDYTLAFVLGSSEGCVPKWGASNDLSDEGIMGPIRELQKIGGRFIVATGGAVGPYFEQLCTSVDSLAKAYKTVLDAVKTNHLDIDVESTIDTDTVTKALAKVQKERPGTTVSFTLMVQAEDYGLNPPLGSDVLKMAKKNGVRVDIVNPMAMEFSGSSSDWGDAVIGSAKSVLRNMREIWPEKSDSDLKKMLGVTPMLGRNFNGRIFDLTHAQKLVNWANANHIGLLAFWSVGRDNGSCAGGGISATCSSIAQSDYQFIKIFQGFKG